MWRAVDAALLDRLEDERILERLWQRVAPGAEPLHPRAAGLIRLLRARPDAAAALDAAERGDASALVEALAPSRLSGWTPPLVHHLALFHRARAEELASADRGALDAAELDRSLTMVIACWLALGRERDYLEALARDVVGGALSEDDVGRAVDEAALRGIDAVAELARAGAAARTKAAGIALGTLATVESAVAIAAAPDALAELARRRAETLRTQVVHAALAPITEQLDELAAREWTVPEVVAAFATATEVWRWAGEEVEVERLLARELPRFAWDLYRARRWDDLRAVLRPLEGPSERLAERIEHDPAQLAWTAQCAQVLVFRAELAPTLDAQVALAERAYALCPTHHNARLVLADLLCSRAERRLGAPPLLRLPGDEAAARRDVARAEAIFPELRRLPAVREKLARRRGGASS